MITRSGLEPSLILLDVHASSLDQVLQVVARAASPVTGVEAMTIEHALHRATRSSGFALGRGVALPHADIAGLAETSVALLRTRQPIPVQALDRRPADLFFVVLSRPGDPKQHLLLLAHLARLAQSRVLRHGLRQASTATEALELIRAAEMRQVPDAQAGSPVQGAPHYLAVISVAGEQVADALLVSLLDQGFGDASLLEAQSVREAATREVPLFAGFHDIFGDPGGRRVLLLEVTAERVDALTTTVRRIFEEHDPSDGRFSLVPLQSCWRWQPPRVDEPAGGH